MKSKPDYADAIRRYCPVLSGKQATCAGCKYERRPSYDCRGLTRLALKAATGRMLMGAGATTQWNDAGNWEIRGILPSMPDRPCLLFVQKSDMMSHTGIYVGSGWCVHASGHSAGVVKSRMPRNWTHWGVPIGLEGDVDEVADEWLIRRRDKGEKVRALQGQLMKSGYPLPGFGADGDFGAETEAAVRRFQADYEMEVDGAWDATCQDLLENRMAAMADAAAPETDLERIFASLAEIRGLIGEALAILKA